jgi:hypothetical protein
MNLALQERKSYIYDCFSKLRLSVIEDPSLLSSLIPFSLEI